MRSDDPIHECRRKQRMCLAQFLDANPGVFPLPSAAPNWAELARRGTEPDPGERASIDRAMSMLLSVFKSAQPLAEGAEGVGTLEEVFASPQAQEIPPDETALAFDRATGNDAADGVAFARAVTAFKRAVSTRQVNVSEIKALVDDVLGQVPGNSALMRSLVETAGDMLRIQIDALFAQETTLEAA